MSELKSPLARLVLFMVCLSIAGACIAAVHYAAVDLPQQKAVTTPSNGYDPNTMYECTAAWVKCRDNCGPIYNYRVGDCENQCSQTLMICNRR